MKKFILLFIFVIAYSQSSAQSEEDTLVWAPVGAKWWYTYNNAYPWGEPGYEDFYTVESMQDTFIGGVNARLLEWRINDTDYYTHEIMYNEGQKVYFYHFSDQSWYLLYDFSVEAGDTLVLIDTSFTLNQPYPLTSWHSGDINNFILYVESTDEIQVEGHTLKTFKTSSIIKENGEALSEWNYMYGMGYAKVIKKIGSNYSLFGHPTELFPELSYGGLRCYKDSTLFYNTSTSGRPCDFTEDKYYNIEKITKPYENIVLYPNPVKHETLNIKIEDLSDQKQEWQYQVYDIKGREFISGIFVSGPSSHAMNVEMLKPGIYLLKLKNNAGDYRLMHFVRE